MRFSIPLVPSAELERIADARHHDPHAVLGLHALPDDRFSITAYAPHVRAVSLQPIDEPLQRIGQSDCFQWRGALPPPSPYRLRVEYADGSVTERHDPYAYPVCLSAFDLHLFSQGQHYELHRLLGSHWETRAGVRGLHFTVWAPNAERVSVVGDFNRWDGRCHPMCAQGSSGLYALFIPDFPSDGLYKYEIRNRDSGEILLKADPCAQRHELRPGTASLPPPEQTYEWGDAGWMQRPRGDFRRQPISILEVHLASWQRPADRTFLNYRELAHRLCDYALDLGYTHLELLPITEHPLDESWGYQSTGLFAPTSRYGSPNDFRYFVDHCHRRGLGVILDWAPAHFPRDAHALARFDGSALYEHEDPRLGEHPDWGTLVYNYGRNEVRNFLVASALNWLGEYHIDGLRVDAVASMLYLDYSRKAGEWLPNAHGGRENLDAVRFLRELNHAALTRHPHALMIAEESTAWPQVTRPPEHGGLGFSLKWNMGWMHDSLDYLSQDPIHRRYHHRHLTFGQLYAYSENFVLAYSHDEVVHGKGSLLRRMPGDEWQRFANLRLLHAYLYTSPGKKLMFMGDEFGQWNEWDARRSLSWELLHQPLHRGVQALVRELNRLYAQEPALHAHDCEPQGFQWLECHDAERSLLSFARWSEGRCIIVVLNFTPVPRQNYRLGVPLPGFYRELLNSDAALFGGSNWGNFGGVHTEQVESMGHVHSIRLSLPPLACLILKQEAG